MRANRALPLACAAIAAGAIFLSGCGGGGGGSSSPGAPPPSVDPLVVLINNGVTTHTTPNIATIQPVNTIYANELAGSNDPTINAGFGITEAALAAEQIAQFNGVSLLSHVGSKTSLVSTSTPFSTLSQDLLIWNIPSMIASGKFGQVSAQDVMPSLTASAGKSSTTVASEQTELRAIDANLALAETALNVVIAHPSFTISGIRNPADPTNPSDTVKLGTAEFQTLEAVIELARAFINASVAYDLDPGPSSVFSTPVSTAFAGQYAATSGGPVTIAPSVYLSPSPFGTLESDGTTRMHTVPTETTAAVNNAVNAINTVETRNNAGFLLNPGTTINTTQLDSAKTQIQNFGAFFTAQGTININSTQTVVIDLPHFFNTPPADLKSLSPTITATSLGGGVIQLDFNRTNFPDTTFAGLFPNGYPNLNGTPYDSSTSDQTQVDTVLQDLTGATINIGL